MRIKLLIVLFCLTAIIVSSNAQGGSGSGSGSDSDSVASDSDDIITTSSSSSSSAKPPSNEDTETRKAPFILGMGFVFGISLSTIAIIVSRLR